MTLATEIFDFIVMLKKADYDALYMDGEILLQETTLKHAEASWVIVPNEHHAHLELRYSFKKKLTDQQEDAICAHEIEPTESLWKHDGYTRAFCSTSFRLSTDDILVRLQDFDNPSWEAFLSLLLDLDLY